MAAAAASILAAPLLFAGCDDAPSQPRRGGAGASCERTNDCEAPLSCIGEVCGGPGSDGGTEDAGTGGSGGGTNTDAGAWSACDECLDTECKDSLAACDGECLAIEACIEAQCKHLGDLGNDAEEGACFVACQSAHSSGKEKHLAVVNCAQETTCLPPCVPYPQDFEGCREFMDNGICKDERGACEASLDCKNYRECVSVCKTASECITCDDTPAGSAGRALLEAYELCVATECISESWLPTGL
jgi:hypothetical protein